MKHETRATSHEAWMDYKTLEKKMKEVSALTQIADILEWDQETMLPERGAAARAAQKEALAALIHEKETDPSIGDALRGHSASGDLSEDERVCVREWLRDYDKAVKLPEDLVREIARVTSLACDQWVKSRKKSDFKSFSPWLKKIIDLKRREAEAVGYEGHIYDALLDDFEPRMTVARLDPILEEVRQELVPIAKAINDSSVSADAKILTKFYPEAVQEPFVRELPPLIGLDMKAARLDRSAHPFCACIVSTDVRITTRYEENWIPGSVYGVIHETGHALYEQGFDDKWTGTPLAEAVSMGIHESQSRLWENSIGRGRPFVSFLLPRMKKEFAKQMKGVSADAFYRAINRVSPSLIRAEADEVTYNLHILLRTEIEKGLLCGEIDVDDLPAIWNDKMKSYLGIKPKNDAEGVLQDIHWSLGMIGYFPTYLLGNLYSAQLWTRLRRSVPAVDSKIAKGQFAPILKWLRTNVHGHGRRYPPHELIERATGEPPSAKFFLEYLKKKYGEIYKIKW